MLIYTSCRCDLGHNSASSPMLADAWRPSAAVSWLRTPCWAGPPMFTEDCAFYPRILTVLNPRGHSTSPPSRSQLTRWPVMGSGTVHPGATKGKCWKSDFFFYISHSMMCKVIMCQNTMSRKELLLPSSCQLARGDSKRLLKQINWKQGTSSLLILTVLK